MKTYIDFGYGLEPTDVKESTYRMMQWRDEWDWLWKRYMSNKRDSMGTYGLLEARWKDKFGWKPHSIPYFEEHTWEELKDICQEDFKKCTEWIERKIKECSENPDGIWEIH